MISLPDFLRAPGVSRFDLFKIDVEGAETELRAGAAESIERWHPVIVSEVNGVTTSLASRTPGELLATIERHGFRICALAENGRVEDRPGCPDGEPDLRGEW